MRHVSNLLAVHRVRPQDHSSDEENSDDLLSDEELEISTEMLSEALATRIGGRKKAIDEDGKDETESRRGRRRRKEISERCVSMHRWAGGVSLSTSKSRERCHDASLFSRKYNAVFPGWQPQCRQTGNFGIK